MNWSSSPAGIFTIAVSFYNVGARLFCAIRFVWATIALDIVVVALQLPGLITCGHWLRITPSMAWIDDKGGEIGTIDYYPPAQKPMAIMLVVVTSVQL